MIIQAPAKINLSLDVLGRRADGYHTLRMLMQTVSLRDTLTITPCPGRAVRLRTNISFLPTDQRNLASAAALRFFERTGLPPAGLFINLEKRIPITAGLGGGSADAAAMLRALNVMFHAGLTARELCELALTLGTDVPFCVLGGTALAEGVGEVLTPLPPLPDCTVLLCKPPFSVSTPQVFAKINCRRITQRPDTPGLLQALREGDLTGVARRMFNVLENVTAAQYPEIREIKHKMIHTGALGAVMSGSGPTVLGIFDDFNAAQAACALLQAQYADTYITRPVPALGNVAADIEGE